MFTRYLYNVDNKPLFNYTDDNSVNLQSIVAALVNDTQLMITRFTNNNMGANSDKLQALLWPFLLTWFNFNPSMDKQSHAW